MKKLLASIFSVALLSAVFAPVVSAAEFDTNYSRHGEMTTLGESEVIERDFFATGETVRINGTVIGDAYIAGGQVYIDGVIDGDLLVAGGSVNINGDVTQNVRVGGGNVYINGRIGRNLTVGAGNVEISDNAEIGGSLVAGAGNVNLNAPIGGNIMAGVGNFIIASTVGGDVDAGVGTLVITDGAEIAGDVNYISDEEADIGESALVGGSITNIKPEQVGFPEKPTRSETDGDGLGLLKVFGLLSTLLVGLLLVHFLPNHVQKTVATLRTNPGRSLVYGLVGIFLIPLALLVLSLTVIGIPLALMLMAIYLIYVSLAKIYIMTWAGGWVTKRFGREMGMKGTFIVGLIAFYLLTLIPVVWVLVRIATYFFGFGALLITCRATFDEMRKKKLV